MAVDGAAAQVGDPQVAGVDEPDEGGRLVVQEGIGPHRVCGGAPGFGVLRPDVGAGAVGRGRIAAMAIDAAEPDRLLAVRVMGTVMALHAAEALLVGHLDRLFRQVLTGKLGGDREGAGVGVTRWWRRCLGRRRHLRDSLGG